MPSGADAPRVPAFASELGDKRYNNRWPDLSPEGFRRRHRDDRAVLERLEAIDPAALSPEDRLNLTLFRRKYETAVEEQRFRWWLLPFTAREGIQDAGAVADAIVFETHRDHEDWLERLRLFPEYMDQTIALMCEGSRWGCSHPKVVMRRVPDQIRRQIVADPEQSLFFKPFSPDAGRHSRSVRRDLVEAARDRISASVVPAYRRFLEFFESEYLPACLEEIGIWQLPEGTRNVPLLRPQVHHDGSLTPEEIHEIGLREVARIRDEMGRVIEAIGFRGYFPEFLADLRTNPRFYFTDDAPLLAAYRETCERVDVICPGCSPIAPGLVRHPACPEQHRSGHDDRLLPATVGRRQASGYVFRQPVSPGGPAELRDRGAFAPRGLTRTPPPDRTLRRAGRPAGLPSLRA